MRPRRSTLIFFIIHAINSDKCIFVNVASDVVIPLKGIATVLSSSGDDFFSLFSCYKNY